FFGPTVAATNANFNINSTQTGTVPVVFRVDQNLVGQQPAQLLTVGTVNVTGNGAFQINNIPTFPTMLGNFKLQTTDGANGNITLGTLVGTPSNAMSFIMAGSGSLIQNAGVIQSSNLTITSATGNIGTPGTPINTQVLGITATTGGAGSVNISNTIFSL